MEDIIVLIPSYKPNKTIMLDFMQKLIQKFKRIIVINDASGKDYDVFFKKIKNLGITVISYEKNKGKGRSN